MRADSIDGIADKILRLQVEIHSNIVSLEKLRSRSKAGQIHIIRAHASAP